MNLPMLFYYLGFVMRLEAFFMIPPLLIAAYGHNLPSVLAFAGTMAVLLAIGSALAHKKPENSQIYAKEGFVVVALAWVVMSVFGAVPFIAGGYVPSVLDAIFETVSGFTTTGASILTDVESLPKDILYWRSFTHWLGGMGVLIFALWVVPLSGDSSLYLMRAESPGPITKKFSPKIRQTAKIMYRIYIVITLLEVAALFAGGMPLFDSFVTAFATAGTGGFAVRNASIAGYGSLYIDVVITFFMALFGVNFSLYYFLVLGRIKDFFRSEELRVYFAVMLGAIVLISVNIYGYVYQTIGETLRFASFQVSSVMTTTGFVTADFDVWPQFSRMLLIFLMFIGASAGSTGGGMKVARIILAVKAVRRKFLRVIHPAAYKTLFLDGEPVDDDTLDGISVYFLAYILIFSISVLLVSIDNFDFESTFTAVVACINNIGPGLKMVGATGNYSQFSALSKIVLIVNMLIGRLEIYPIIILMMPFVWKKSVHKSERAKPSGAKNDGRKI